MIGPEKFCDAFKLLQRAMNHDSAKHLVSRLVDFKSAKSGNIAMLFGLALVPFIGAVGLSVDYGMAVSARTRLQANVDSAALAAGREFQVTGSTSAATARAASTFTALMSNDPNAVLIGNSIEESTSTIQLTAQTSVQTSFAGVLGVQNLDVGATSSATLAQGGLDQNLEVAMSLDVTGSMSGSKIADLKIAAKDLIDIVLHDSISEYTSRVALVPFSSSVRPAADILSQVRDPSVSSTHTFQTNWGANYTWNLSDCVSERHGANAFNDEAPNGAANRYMTPVYASGGSCRPVAEIIPLSDDKDMLKDHVDTFQATGATGGHLGTAWAWYMLSREWENIVPTASKPNIYDEDTMKVAILMTDGVYNEQYTEDGIDDDYVSGSSSNGTSSYQAGQLCTGMKDKDIVVYTIGFAVSSSSVQQMLEDCATSENHYFLADDGAELQAAFREIAFKLVQLRLSQ